MLSVVRRIPPGRVATYGDIAALAGRPRAARAVGNIMGSNGRSDVPAHRVVAAGGALGGYGGHESLKRALLMAEGITFRGARVNPFSDLRWTPVGTARRRATAALRDESVLTSRSQIPDNTVRGSIIGVCRMNKWEAT